MSAQRTISAMKKLRYIDEIINNLNKQYPDSIVSMGQEIRFTGDVIKTGIETLNESIGVGGIPVGRLIEVYGAEGVGKTTVCLHIVSEFQKAQNNNGKCKVCLYIDAEHGLDPKYAKAIGVSVDHLILTQSVVGEEILNIASKLIKTGEVGLVILDSVPALVPRAEIEGEIGQSTVALQARLMSQFMRIITPLLWDSGCTLILINQLRDAIGSFGFGPPKSITPGGRAIKFYASVRIQLKTIATITNGDAVLGSKIQATITKNKVGSPYRKAEFDIIYGQGASEEGILINKALEKGIIVKSGSWIKWKDGEAITQGIESLREKLNQDQELKNKIKELINELG